MHPSVRKLALTALAAAAIALLPGGVAAATPGPVSGSFVPTGGIFSPPRTADGNLIIEAHGTHAWTGSFTGTSTVDVRIVERDSAPLSGGSCGSYSGSWTQVTLSGGADTSVQSGNCYRYRYSISDNVSNQATSALSENCLRSIDHDLADLRILEQGLEWAQAEDIVHDQFGKLLAVVLGDLEFGFLAVLIDQLGDAALHHFAAGGIRVDAERRDQALVDGLFDAIDVGDACGEVLGLDDQAR